MKLFWYSSAQVQLLNPVRFGQNIAKVGPYKAMGEWMCIINTHKLCRAYLQWYNLLIYFLLFSCIPTCS